MKPVHLLTAVLTQPLDILELYQLAINNRIANLSSEEESLAVGKSNADLVAEAFSEEIEHIQHVLPKERVIHHAHTKYDESIVAFVKANPGCSTRQIQEAVGIKYNSHWSLIKARIVTKNLMHCIGATTNLRWFPGPFKSEKGASEPIQATTNEKLVLNYIQSNPGCQRPEILKDLGITVFIWNRINVRLRQEGSIVMKGERKGARWYPAQSSQTVLPFKKVS